MLDNAGDALANLIEEQSVSGLQQPKQSVEDEHKVVHQSGENTAKNADSNEVK